jgi:6-hydroxytryprostatin B O-methyltransferase
LDLGTLRAIIKLDIPRAVPMGEPITFEDLAQRLKVDQDLLKRIIQYSVSNGIFCEDPPGYVQHTPASTAMMSDKLSYILHWSADICMASSLSMWEAIKAQNDPNSERKAAFNHALNTSDPLYEYLMKDNVLAAIFKKIVSEDFAINEINPTQVATAYNWSKLGKGTVVDVSQIVFRFGTYLAY